MADTITLEMQKFAQDMEAQNAAFAGQTTPVVTPTGVDPVATGSVVSDLVNGYKAKSALEDFYANQGTLAVDKGWIYNSTDWKKTFLDSASRDPNLNINALETVSPEIKDFANVMRAHPDLRDGFNEFLAGEGLEGVQALQSVLTQDGATNSADFAEMMENPMKRKMVSTMLTNVGKSEAITPEHAKEFIQAGLDLPEDSKAAGYDQKMQRFLKSANAVGIDPGAEVTNQLATAAMTMFKDIFVNGFDIQNTINQFMSTLQGMGMDTTAFEPFMQIFGAGAGLLQPGPEARRVTNALTDKATNLVESGQNVMGEIEKATVRSFSPAKAKQDALSEEANKPGTMQNNANGAETKVSLDERSIMPKSFETAALGVTIRQPEVAPEWTNNVGNNNAFRPQSFGMVG